MKMRLRDGTGSIDLRYLYENFDRHGNCRLYFRRDGKKIRLRAEVGTDAFMEEYRRALNGETITQTAEKPGTFRWLLTKYFSSAEFLSLRSSTQTVRRGILETVCRERFEGGVAIINLPFALMESRHIRFVRDRKAETPFAANHRVKALRQLFDWAVEHEFAAKNPARDVPLMKTPSEGFRPWDEQDVKNFRDRHPLGSKARLAFELLVGTGQRRSDVVRMGRQHVRDGVLTVRQQKTGTLVEIPVLPETRDAIEAMPKNDHLAFLTTQFGEPFTPAGFGNWFRDRCIEAGVADSTAHGVRKFSATYHANQGATAHELMAWFGWKTIREAERYTKDADRRRLAHGFGQKLSRISEQKLNISDSPADPVGQKSGKDQ